MMKPFLVLCCFWCCAIALAQENTSNNLRIHQDNRINAFYRDLQIFQIRTNYPNEVPVYQVQMISTKNRLDALRIKKDAEELIANLPNEIIFKEPYYKLKVGLYRSRAEAEELRQKIDDFFLNKKAIIIIPSLLNTDIYVQRFFEKK